MDVDVKDASQAVLARYGEPVAEHVAILSAGMVDYSRHLEPQFSSIVMLIMLNSSC
jgi:hypothetical protein